MAEWVNLITGGGAVGVLAVIVFLFWKGDLVSKATVTRIIAVYDAQAKVMSNGFLSKLEAATDKQCISVDGLVETIKESTSEAKQSRSQMQEVVRQFSTSLGKIEANTSGAPRKVVRRARRS